MSSLAHLLIREEKIKKSIEYCVFVIDECAWSTNAHSSQLREYKKKLAKIQIEILLKLHKELKEREEQR